MSASSDRFADLQAQTDQSRVEFLRADLALCFTLASFAETEQDFGHQEAAERSIAHAQQGYSSIQRFLSDPKHAEHIDDATRRHLPFHELIEAGLANGRNAMGIWPLHLPGAFRHSRDVLAEEAHLPLREPHAGEVRSCPAFGGEWGDWNIAVNQISSRRINNFRQA